MLNIIMIGPQGSGKGTQAQIIAKEHGLKYIEAGAMIRKQGELPDKKSEIIDHLVNKKGMLLPDGIVLDMLYDEIEGQPNDKGYLFDGFPRTVLQYQALKEFLKSKGGKIDIVFYLHLSDEEAVKRLSGRLVCSACKKVYSQFLEPKREKCDCQGMLSKRKDDEPEAILKRLSLFHQYTLPILKMMQKEGLLREINGEQTIEKISSDTRQQLSSLPRTS